jgi:hypothetical protein
MSFQTRTGDIDMTDLSVRNLEQETVLDTQALTTLAGGIGASQGIGNGGAFGFANVEGGGILSPTINVQTIVNMPISIQLTNILEQIQLIDTTSIIASVVSQL